jgi:hypothetical protein
VKTREDRIISLQQQLARCETRASETEALKKKFEAANQGLDARIVSLQQKVETTEEQVRQKDAQVNELENYEAAEIEGLKESLQECRVANGDLFRSLKDWAHQTKVYQALAKDWGANVGKITNHVRESLGMLSIKKYEQYDAVNSARGPEAAAEVAGNESAAAQSEIKESGRYDSDSDEDLDELAAPGDGSQSETGFELDAQDDSKEMERDDTDPGEPLDESGAYFGSKAQVIGDLEKVVGGLREKIKGYNKLLIVWKKRDIASHNFARVCRQDKKTLQHLRTVQKQEAQLLANFVDEKVQMNESDLRGLHNRMKTERDIIDREIGDGEAPQQIAESLERYATLSWVDEEIPEVEKGKIQTDLHRITSGQDVPRELKAYYDHLTFMYHLRVLGHMIGKPQDPSTAKTWSSFWGRRAK